MITITMIMAWLATAESDNRDNVVGADGEVSAWQLSPIAIRHVNEVFHSTSTSEEIGKDRKLAYLYSLRYRSILEDHYERRNSRKLNYKQLNDLCILVRMWNGGPDGYTEEETFPHLHRFFISNKDELQLMYKIVIEDYIPHDRVY